jgi:signal transduction histidine kinase
MTPIVVLTAADEEEVGERALEEGAEDYLIKGQVNKAVLFRSLNCAILRHRFLNKVSYEGESVRKSEFQLRQLVAAREASIEAERTRVSRDLHNYSEQFLSAIKMDLVWAGHRLIESPRVEVKMALGERLAETQGLVDRTIESLQKIALELRPNVLDHLGLVDALKDEARRFEKRTKIGVNLELYESLSKLHVDTTTTLFRICQELLAGISTQSQASIIDIFLNVDGPFLELRVKDNEAGLKWVTSLEILGVRERAYSLGGEFKFEITPHVGTEAIVRVPLRLA